MTLRVGLLGCGYWGARLLRVFAALPEIDVVLAVDAEAAARETIPRPIARSADTADLWRDPAIDAVLIATPPASHVAPAREALRAGKHCWVEKPLALSLSEAKELVALADQVGRRLFVDETFLYDPLIRTAREWIAAGRLGTLQHLSCERTGLGRVRRDSDVWWNSAPHDLSILRYLSGQDVASLQVEGFAHFQENLADHAVAALRLRGGVSAHIYLSWLSPEKRANVVAVGSAGMLRYEGRFAQRELVRYELSCQSPHEAAGNVVSTAMREAERIPGGDDEPLALAARAFVDLVTRGIAAPSEGHLSLHTVEVLQRGADTMARTPSPVPSSPG